MIKTVSKQQTQPEINPYDKFGTGAESKIRLEEVITTSNKKANSAYYATPIPEGRMRAQEQSRFVSTDVKPQEYDRRHSKPTQGSGRPNPVPIATGNASTKPAPKNPFDEDDDKYDETKNPFADDVDSSPTTDVANELSNKDTQANNPFDEYDDDLNPFE